MPRSEGSHTTLIEVQSHSLSLYSSITDEMFISKCHQEVTILGDGLDAHAHHHVARLVPSEKISETTTTHIAMNDEVAQIVAMSENDRSPHDQADFPRPKVVRMAYLKTDLRWNAD